MNTKGQQIGCKHRQMEAAACGATGWRLFSTDVACLYLEALRLANAAA